MDNEEKAYTSLLIKTLEKIFTKEAKAIGKEKVGVLVSGGIDSSTIATFATHFFEKITLLSFGTSDNFDLPYAKILQKNLNKPLVFEEVKDNDIKKNLPLVKEILREASIEENITQISLALGYFLIFRRAKKVGIKYVFTGQGPDILLGGYHQYDKVPLTDLNQTIEKDLPALELDKKRDGGMAQYFDIKLLNPYLDQEFVRACLKIPAYLKIKENGKRIKKYILRQVGERIGLPQEIVNRPKKAFQYSTKIQTRIGPYLGSDPKQHRNLF